VTTLAILHDSLLAAATEAKERVSISFKLHPAALQHCCELLWPQLDAQRGQARHRKLAAALQVRVEPCIKCINYTVMCLHVFHNARREVRPLLRLAGQGTRQHPNTLKFSYAQLIFKGLLLSCCSKRFWQDMPQQCNMTAWPKYQLNVQL
jgi:hypothetical protein